MTKNKKITIKDISEISGVSLGAVSKVLNNHKVRETTYLKVKEAIKATGYKPNSFARGIRSHVRGNIGIITPKLRHTDWLGDLVINLIASKKDGNINFLTEVIDLKNWHVPNLLSLVDGLIIIGEFCDEFYEALEDNGNLPVVVYGDCPKYNKFFSVFNDNFYSGKLLTEYLISMKHKKIAFISYENSANNLRKEGYIEAMTEAYGRVDESYIISTENLNHREIDMGFDMTNELLDNKKDVTAIIYATDFLANGVFHSLNNFNYEIPKNLSIATFSGVEDIVETRPNLCKVVFNNKKLAVFLMDSLNLLISKKKYNIVKNEKFFVLRRGESVASLK